MRVIGIDAALRYTGWGVLDGDRLLDYGVIETATGDGSGAAEFERIARLRDALCEVLVKHARYRVIAGDGGAWTAVARVGIERTDWSRGRGDDRAAWVREAKARGALGTGFAVACCVCLEFDIKPHILGAKEWMSLFGAEDKESAAAMIALQFSDVFYRGVRGCRPNSHKQKPAVRELQTNAVVPDHVTDAIGLALTLQRKLEFEARIAAARSEAASQSEAAARTEAANGR